jgi:hypothetical protein
MSWYSARLLFEADVEDDTPGDVLAEGSIRLIEAKDEEDALAQAETIGIEARHAYLDDDGHAVAWVFKGVLEVQDLCETVVQSGMEVFSMLSTASRSQHE